MSALLRSTVIDIGFPFGFRELDLIGPDRPCRDVVQQGRLSRRFLGRRWPCLYTKGGRRPAERDGGRAGRLGAISVCASLPFRGGRALTISAALSHPHLASATRLAPPISHKSRPRRPGSARRLRRSRHEAKPHRPDGRTAGGKRTEKRVEQG